MRPQAFLYLCLLVFVATLALIIGWRLPAETRMVTLGVLAGVVASVPTSLLVAWLTTRVLLERHRPAPPPAPPAAEPPRLVVVPPRTAQTPQARRLSPWHDAAAPATRFDSGAPRGPGRLTIIGSDDDPQ
jgi:hypothetical protein